MDTIDGISGSCPKDVGDGNWKYSAMGDSDFKTESGWEVKCMECCKKSVQLNSDPYDLSPDKAINGKPVYSYVDTSTPTHETTFLVYHVDKKRWIAVTKDVAKDDDVNGIDIDM